MIIMPQTERENLSRQSISLFGCHLKIVTFGEHLLVTIKKKLRTTEVYADCRRFRFLSTQSSHNLSTAEKITLRNPPSKNHQENCRDLLL